MSKWTEVLGKSRSAFASCIYDADRAQNEVCVYRCQKIKNPVFNSGICRNNPLLGVRQLGNCFVSCVRSCVRAQSGCVARSGWNLWAMAFLFADGLSLAPFQESE